MVCLVTQSCSQLSFREQTQDLVVTDLCVANEQPWLTEVITALQGGTAGFLQRGHVVIPAVVALTRLVNVVVVGPYVVVHGRDCVA